MDIPETRLADRLIIPSTLADPTANGLYLHASAVVIQGGAVLFLGHSTSGKSTMTCLLRPICSVLADDTVLVKRNNGGAWRVTDGKGWFASPSTQPSTAPLRACFRIHKGPDLRIEQLAPLELARCLMDAVMEVDVQRKCGRLDPSDSSTAPDAIAEARTMRRKWFQDVATLAHDYRGNRMWFPLDADPREIVKAIIESGSRWGVIHGSALYLCK